MKSMLLDLFRPDAWQHRDYYPRSRFWTYTREGWTPRHRWLPSIGGDEWCRWTLVLPVPFGGYVVVALWECRDPQCEACEVDCCRLLVTPSRTDRQPPNTATNAKGGQRMESSD